MSACLLGKLAQSTLPKDFIMMDMSMGNKCGISCKEMPTAKPPRPTISDLEAKEYTQLQRQTETEWRIVEDL